MDQQKKEKETRSASECFRYGPTSVGREFWEGDATKQKSVKKSAFSLNEGKAFSESGLW